MKKGTTLVESISAEAAGALNEYNQQLILILLLLQYRRTEEEDRGGPRSVLSTSLVLAFLVRERPESNTVLGLERRKIDQ